MFNWFKKSKTCPNCHRDSSWDGNKCIRCGYIEILAKKNTELLKQVMDLFDPKIYNPHDLYFQKQLIPESPGVYAWYFDNHFGTYFTSTPEGNIKIKLNFSSSQDWYLLYIGVAGKRRGRTLRDRIYGDHLNQNSAGSTLRQSLAALLWQDINLNPAMQLKSENEKHKLNHWIFQHARVSWVESSEPEIIEKILLQNYGGFLSLNIEDNKNNPFRKELQCLRKYWRKAGY